MSVLCVSANAKKKTTEASAQFRQPLAGEQKVEHALNRLTFGARPGDAQQVEKMGLKKWIDLQLHAERIAENPLLTAKLAQLDSLHMSTAQLTQSYPPPGIVKAMVEGKLPFPDDPDKRMMVQRLAARMAGKAGKDSGNAAAADLATLLGPDQLKALRADTPQQKIDWFSALSQDRQDQLLEAMGQGMRMQLYAAAPPALRRRIQSAAGPQTVVAQDLMEAKLERAVYSNRQLEEVLTDFWYNHFNVFLGKGADHYLVTAYERDAIRPHVLGRFEDLLRATAQSPAMLFYLDNWESTGAQSPAGKLRQRGLNENYGRELLELHTLGVDGGYTQKDVTEVARCFTGWSIRQPQRAAEFEFRPRMHDNGEKVVLGMRIAAGGGIEDGYQVLHLLAHHPATAQFISRQLAIRFVADDPPAALVDRMAATFLKKDGDLRAVMKTMFDSPEFWSRGAYRSKMKSPLEMVASAVRTLNADVDFTFGLNQQLTQLGEPLYRKAEPTGYSNSSQEWLNSAGLLARMNFSVALANNKVPGVRVANADPSAGVTLGSPAFQKK
ncbi:MAG TPA: DUF1800 domain-containing protein [Bryobacteraceae bacterium]|nr:DUF1800 domain-containing protein [Bryobacteraceae bacterium]